MSGLPVKVTISPGLAFNLSLGPARGALVRRKGMADSIDVRALTDKLPEFKRSVLVGMHGDSFRENFATGFVVHFMVGRGHGIDIVQRRRSHIVEFVEHGIGLARLAPTDAAIDRIEFRSLPILAFEVVAPGRIAPLVLMQ